jgi:hypothetical protein
VVGSFLSKQGGDMASHEILGGLVQIHKRGGRTWHCAASIDGRQYRVSTKEEGLDQAKAFAEDWYLGLRGKARAGLLKHEKTFAEAAEQFLRNTRLSQRGNGAPSGCRGMAPGCGST